MPSTFASPNSSPDWKLLQPLPDKVGFAGMVGGVLAGQLVVAGGSQFPDRPLWLNGEKAYSDKIFTLDKLNAKWRLHPSTLPRPAAHFATAAGTDAIFFAGGCDSLGGIREAYAMRARAGGFVFERLPDLPGTVIYGAGIVCGDRFYVAGGQDDVGVKTALATVWSLDFSAEPSTRAWRKEPDLPAAAFVGAMATRGGEIYFIGGVGFDETGRALQSKRAFRLEANSTQWTELPAMPEPRVGPVTPCPITASGEILVVGGYASAFAGERRDHPGFSRQTYLYDTAAGRWSDGPVLPHVPPANKDATGDAGPAPMVAATGAVLENHFVIVSGEVRASVRTPAVIAWPLDRR